MRLLRSPARPLVRLLPAAFAALFAAGALPAQFDSVGLSAVRAQRFDNDDLLVFDPTQGDRFAWAAAAGDFDGDGADDLATAIPFHDGFSGSDCFDCGIVVVRYGVAGAGLETASTSTVLYQGFVGSPTPAEEGERFGYALAAGDFNGDGFDDLAVGVPGERHPDVGNDVVGAVEVHYGTAEGLLVQSADWVTRYTPGWEFQPTSCLAQADEFGAALAAGNFDGDAFDDLAIGSPLSCAGSSADPQNSGAVFVAHGGSGGLVPLEGYFLSENSPDIFGDAADGERFGAAVAAGDFDADGFDDLAIGAPLEGDNGSTYVVFGSGFGLIYLDHVFWAPGAFNVAPEAGARLGFALAAGDFDGDGHDDLAIGDPEQDLGLADEIADAGLVAFAFGAPAGFDLSRSVLLGDPPGYDPGDRFGWAIAADDFDGDGKDDVAVGTPFEDWTGINMGSVTVLLGAPDWTSVARIRLFLAGEEGIPGVEQSHVDFGRALATGDFDGNGHADLAIGAPYFDVDGVGADIGVEIVLYGSLFADGFENGWIGYWSDSTK